MSWVDGYEIEYYQDIYKLCKRMIKIWEERGIPEVDKLKNLIWELDKLREHQS